LNPSREKRDESLSSWVKLEAVRLFLEEGRTRAEIARILGLRSAGRVKAWVSQYRHEDDAFRKAKGCPRKQAKGVKMAEDELKRLYRGLSSLDEPGSEEE
jgi:transposase-like protein